jgi:hypothetical protein
MLHLHGDNVKIDPTEDFRREDKFYVLADKQEVVHIMTGNKILHSFGNMWRSDNTIIFKSSGIFFPPPVSDFLTDIRGRLMGESIVKASLRGTYSGFYVRRLPVSTGVPRAFRTQNDCGLQLISTELYPWTTGWEHFIDSPPMDSSPGFCFCIFTERVGPDSPVRSNIITFSCIC